MAETFRALFPQVDVLPLTDGLAAVFNAEATDNRRYFEVTRVAVRPVCAFAGLSTGAAFAAKVGIYRTTATSGGTAVAPVKRDTGSANLPSQVTCTLFPTSVTLSGAALRSLADAPSLTFGGSNQWLGARVYGGAFSPYLRQSQADTIRFGGDAVVERIVLREGEGIAFVLDEYGWPRSGQINLTVRNESSGATYQFRTRDIGHPRLTGQALLSLFNAASSGVVLSVNASEYPNDGESNFPVFRLARIDGVSGGDAVTPAAADTSHSVPSALVCTRGDFATTLYAHGSGVPYDWQYLHGATVSVAIQQKVGQFRGISGMRPFWDVAKTPGFQNGQDETVVLSESSGNGIVLRPNEGLALLAGRAGALETSTFAYFDVEMTVLHYPPPPGGGSNTYSRGRVVNV